MVTAANKFLSTLDQKQQQSVMFAFDDLKQRQRWSNLPTRAVPRAGLGIGGTERSPTVRRASYFPAQKSVLGGTSHSAVPEGWF